LPTPDAVTPPPPDATAAVPLKDVPIPRVRPKPKATLPPEKAPDADMEAIQALLDKRRLEEMASTEAPPTQSPPTVGVPDAAPSASMTANELELLRSRLAQCWAPPLGWTDPTEVRVVLVLSLNPDGSVAGRPQVLESPQGQYSNAAPESAIRAVMRCAPYSLPAAKYDSWKQVKITFDPRDMGAT
jgi:colicin import membrane protein